ncbi:MAG: hypothetical protein SGI96_18675, partial [Bacteroidota bacterium]|nr:hypothetical protein [Bacteroidota bacterium]
VVEMMEEITGAVVVTRRSGIKLSVKIIKRLIRFSNQPFFIALTSLCIYFAKTKRKLLNCLIIQLTN